MRHSRKRISRRRPKSKSKRRSKKPRTSRKKQYRAGLSRAPTSRIRGGRYSPYYVITRRGELPPSRLPNDRPRDYLREFSLTPGQRLWLHKEAKEEAEREAERRREEKILELYLDARRGEETTCARIRLEAKRREMERLEAIKREMERREAIKREIERHEAIKREADRLILQSQSGSRALGDWGIMEKLLELDRMPSKKSATRLRELVKDETGEKNLPRNKKILKSHVYNLLKSRNYDFSQLDDILEEERSRAN